MSIKDIVEGSNKKQDPMYAFELKCKELGTEVGDDVKELVKIVIANGFTPDMIIKTCGHLELGLVRSREDPYKVLTLKEITEARTKKEAANFNLTTIDLDSKLPGTIIEKVKVFVKKYASQNEEIVKNAEAGDLQAVLMNSQTMGKNKVGEEAFGNSESVKLEALKDVPFGNVSPEVADVKVSVPIGREPARAM